MCTTVLACVGVCGLRVELCGEPFPGEGVGRGRTDRLSTGESDGFAVFLGRGGLLVAAAGDAFTFVAFSLLAIIAGGVTFKPGGETFDDLLGIGLMGLFEFSDGGAGTLNIFGVVASLSSSELECFLRVPARTGDFGTFSTNDFGLYFGSAELATVLLVLGRKIDDVRVIVDCC